MTKALAPCCSAEQKQHSVAISSAVVMGKATRFAAWLEAVRSTAGSIPRLLIRLVLVVMVVVVVVLVLLQQQLLLLMVMLLLVVLRKPTSECGIATE